MRLLQVTVALLLVASISAAAGERGEKVPDFRVRTLDGKLVQLSKWVKEGPVFVNFWALWCAPCQRELPYLSAFAAKYGREGLSVLAVSEDGEQAAPRVRSFVKGRRFKFAVVVDRNQELFRLLRVSVLPTSFLVGDNLRILWQHVGYRRGDEREAERAILRALRTP